MRSRSLSVVLVLLPVLVTVSVLGGACTPRPTHGAKKPESPALVSPPPAASTPSPARTASTTPRPPADPCPRLGPHEVSVDETPPIAGTTGRTKAGDWLTARGVSKNAFRSWVRSRDSKLEDFDADGIYDGDDSCETLTVGDKREDALVCMFSVRTSIMRDSAVAFVVRNKRIVAVLQAGLALPSMDWPDARWLDLQLAFGADGLEADVHDRAEPGSVLVMAPSACREHYARYLACEEAHRNGTATADVCPQSIDSAGTVSIGHLSPTPEPSPMGDDRAPLFGCAEALPKLDELVKETGSSGPFAAEFRGDRDFGIRSCKARGHYVWKSDRFVRAGP